MPEVRDDDLSMLYSNVKSKVVSVIKGVLVNPGDENREWMDMVKKWFVEDVDFEFVPLAHVFLYYHYSVSSSDYDKDGFKSFREAVMKRIFEACGGDGEDGESEAMLTTLFNILDPRGRTLLHFTCKTKFLYMAFEYFDSVEQLSNASASIKAECLNARDGAGRSIFHFKTIHDELQPFRGLQSHDGLEVSASIERLSSPQDTKLNVLKQWCFPFGWEPDYYGLTTVDIVVLVNGRNFFTQICL